MTAPALSERASQAKALCRDPDNLTVKCATQGMHNAVTSPACAGLCCRASRQNFTIGFQPSPYFLGSLQTLMSATQHAIKADPATVIARSLRFCGGKPTSTTGILSDSGKASGNPSALQQNSLGLLKAFS
jgi:hypothetical protein